jgi:phage baseplate assembly protein W
MATYIGFSTINANQPRSTDLAAGVDGGTGGTVKSINIGKKYRLLDQPLVLQDFVNALNIPQGQKVGNPAYGTTLWSFIFEPNTTDTKLQLQTEIQRVAAQDPRLIVNSVNSYVQENGILIEIELAIAPFNNPQMLSVFFDNATNTATLQ